MAKTCGRSFATRYNFTIDDSAFELVMAEVAAQTQAVPLP